MAEKTDRRIVRTRKLLRKALLELIEEKGMERVTVSDLTQRAEINRGTFYLHYRDAADLLEQIKREIFEGLKVEMAKINPLELAAYAEKDLAYPPTQLVLHYLKQNADFFRVIFGPNGDVGFPLQIKAFMTEHLYDNIFADIPADRSAPVPRDYLIAYMTSANLGLLMHWIQDGMRLSVEHMSMIITRIVSRGPLGIVTEHRTG